MCRSRVLRLLEPDRQHGKVSQHGQDLPAGRGRLPDGDPVGQHAILFPRRPEAVLRVEALRQEGDLPAHPHQAHAVLYAHLVRGLDLFRLLPRRPLQLLRDQCRAHGYAVDRARHTGRPRCVAAKRYG
uniref:Uncharacterized protein n=1 Tax=Anopheles merus TaxID=30066 RepID=A0A453Z1X4_ANOME